MKHDWIVAQIGSRQHYGVPRGFEATGQLESFYTDAWCWGAWRLLRRGSAPMRAFASRWHVDIPRQKVTAFNLRAIADGIRSQLRKKPT